jgi:Transposase DDE domain group 1
LRLVLDVEVKAGNEHASAHSAPALWGLLDRLGRDRWPWLLRGDADFGTERIMSRAEQEGMPYLFKLRSTRNVKRLIEKAMGEADWTAAGQGWQGKASTLRLQGWSRHRRILRRRLARGAGHRPAPLPNWRCPSPRSPKTARFMSMRCW